MAIFMRQICLVAEHLHPAIDDLSEVFGLAPVFVDEKVGDYGLENTLLGIGTQFLEVVAPLRDGTAAGRYLQRRGGDGGYMVIAQTTEQAEQDRVRANAAANGVRVAMERDGGSYKMMQLHPGDMRASFFSVPFIEGGDPAGTWPFAGFDGWRDKVTADRVTAMTGAELQAEDPEALAAHWSAVSGYPVERRDGVPVIVLANADLRFVEAVDGRGDGLGGLDLKVRDRATVVAAAREKGLMTGPDCAMICGTRFYLR
ncbi:VOC family protein [Oceanicola sp. 22II-s10i]|uniref:VOC family protein n=1 Tax=Oceanicola sp. 22II-s10i TaxID=1317116 RepID=UPI000B51E878|nr:VOC family protein [Oceanicola sp. 22II-s10i]